MSLDLTTCDEQLIIKANDIKSRLQSLRGDAVALAHDGANLGDLLIAWRDAGGKLLPPEVTEDVTRFALKASSSRRRGLIDDPAQLSFALAIDGPEPRIKPAIHREHNEPMEATTKAQALRLYITTWTEREPLEKWDDGTRRALKADLEPLAQLWAKL